MRKSFGDINQINSVDCISTVNFIHWELVALLLHNFPIRKACCHMSTLPFLLQGISSQSVLSDCIWAPLVVQCYNPGCKGRVWMDTEGQLAMNVYMPRAGSDFGVKLGDEGEALGKRE